MSDALTMRRYLEAVNADPMMAVHTLVAEGYHHKVVIAKAEKASSKGYTDYGTSVWFSWLEPKGEEYLRSQTCSNPSTHRPKGPADE